MNYFAESKRDDIKALKDQEKFYKNVYYDRRANPANNKLAPFYKAGFQYGDGIKYLTVGLVKSEDYAGRMDNPLEFKIVEPKVYGLSLEDKVRIKTQVTLKKTEFDHFKNEADLQGFVDLQMATLMKKSELRKNKILPYLFGTEDQIDVVFAPNEKTVLTNLKNKIALIKSAPYDWDPDNDVLTYKSFAAKLREVSYQLTIESAGNSMCCQLKSNGKKEKQVCDVCKELWSYSPVEKQILILSFNDVEAFNMLSETFSPGRFQLPAVKTIVLPIPAGTAYLIDADGLQIYEYFDTLLNDFSVNTLDYKYILHEWYLIGLVHHLPGRKICKFIEDN